MTRAGFLRPGPWTGTGPWSVRNWTIELEVTNQNHPPWSVENLSPTKLVPCTKRFGDLWNRGLYVQTVANLLQSCLQQFTEAPK